MTVVEERGDEGRSCVRGDSSANACSPAAVYETLMGHPPPVDESDNAWQWAYRGRKSERELLLDLIQNEAEEEAEQMSLC